MKKRVVCFYRVSTKQQIIEDDIPVQRNTCLEFINKKNDWVFVGEYIEKGVSGFKVHANDREKLEELKTDALLNKFDIVLVSMFDRLGRIEEETPFVLKWFVDNGIEMWSVNEGQRRFDNHVDNLLNYITFWQASGESKKTQIRTLESKKQMAEEGRFLGCEAPYGYKHISTGAHNKKGREIKKLVIDEEARDIVKEMYNLMVYKGYGSRRISKYLNDKNIPTKRGAKWASSTVLSILKNSIYKGYFAYGRRKAPDGTRKFINQYDCIISDVKHDDLVIVSEELWERANNIIKSKKNNQTGIPKTTKSPLLFTGYIFCKHCGSRMTLKYSYNHHKRKDGTYNRNKKAFYQCYNRCNGIVDCGNKSHSANVIHDNVLKQLYVYLDNLEQLELDKNDFEEQKRLIKKYEDITKISKNKIKKHEEDINLLKKEIINVIKGTSSFTQELLAEQIDEMNKEKNLHEKKLVECENEITSIKKENENLEELKKLMPKYRDIFESEDIEVKKMILPNFISRIIVGTDSIDVYFNINKQELIKYMSA